MRTNQCTKTAITIWAGTVDGRDVSVDGTKLDGIASGATNTPLASTAAATVGTANAIGVDTTAARADHVHDHGAQTSGTLHAAATTSVAGFQSAADKTKLDGIRALATSASLIWGNSSVSTTTTPRYLSPGYTDALAPTTSIQFRLNFPGTLKNLRVRHNTTAGNGNAIVYTVRINSVAPRYPPL